MIPRGGQNPQHAGYVAPDRPYDCGKCVAYHARAYGFPELLPENADAWRLYFVLQDQQRVGMDLLGLDYTVLPIVFDLEGVPHAARPLLFEKLAVVNHAEQAQRAEKRRQDEQRRSSQTPGSGGRRWVEVA